MTSEIFAPLAAALADIDGLEPLPCDGAGHPAEGAAACVHVRCTLKSPEREELLAWLAPLVRRGRWVMSALVARRDLYSLSFRPARPADNEAAALALATLLADPAARADTHIPDRRGR